MSSQYLRSGLTGLCFAIIVALSGSCREETFSPSQADSFVKFFGTHQKDEGIDIKSLDDGGFILLGTTSTENSGTDIILIITDKYGNAVRNSRQFGGPFDDRAGSIIKLSDGGMAILGSITVLTGNDAMASNMYLIRTDGQGDTLWTRNYGDSSDQTGYHLAETSDGGFILIGSSENSETGEANILLVKTDLYGEIQWTRVHGGPGDDVGTYIAETDDGFIYTGYTRSYSQTGQSNANVFIVKTNHLGRVIFPFTYGNSGDDYGKSLIPMPDGGFLVLGTTTNQENNRKNVFLARIGENISNPVWIETYGADIDHVASCFKITNDGNIIITGTQELSPRNHAIFLLKTDSNGNQLFLRTYGGSGRQNGKAVDIADDGGYVIAGSNELDGNSMITLIKTKPGGEL
jgi:hypothetical protein